MGYQFGPQDTVSESQAFWTLMGQALASNGVVSGALNGLAVSVVSGMQVHADTGQAWIQGFFFQSDAAVAATLATADPSNPRIDRIVAHIDMSAHTADIRALTGTPAGSPTPPALTQTSTVWEISLAKIAVGAAVSSIVGGNITDERTYMRAAGPEGSGSGLDADKLDGHDSSYFAVAPAPTTLSSAQHVSGSGTGVVHILDYTAPADGQYRVSCSFRVGTTGAVTVEVVYTDSITSSSRTAYFEAMGDGLSSATVMDAASVFTGQFAGESLLLDCKASTTISCRVQNAAGGGSDKFTFIIERLL